MINVARKKPVNKESESFKKYREYKSRQRPPSLLEKIAIIPEGVLAMWFSLWVLSKFDSWLNPHPETASSFLRLISIPLNLLVWLLTFLVTVFSLIFATIIIKKKLGNQDTLRFQAEEPVPDKPDAPSTLGYWFLIVFFGGIFLAVVYFIFQDMLIRHFPGEDWFILVMASMILGAPGMLGILQVRRIGSGKPPEEAFSTRSTTVSPTVGYFFGGFFLILILSADYYSFWETNQFLKTARPATGVVTRWNDRGSGRGRYQTLEICFTTPDGKTRTLESENHSLISFLMPNVGQRVGVLYNPKDPADFRADQFSEIWSRSIYCTFLLFLVSGAAWLGYLKRRRRSGIPN